MVGKPSLTSICFDFQDVKFIFMAFLFCLLGVTVVQPNSTAVKTARKERNTLWSCGESLLSKAVRVLHLLCLVITRKGSQSSRRRLCQPDSKRPCRKTGLYPSHWSLTQAWRGAAALRLQDKALQQLQGMEDLHLPLNGRVLGRLLGRRTGINSLFRESLPWNGCIV